LKPALGKAIESLVPVIQKNLGDLIDKLVPSKHYMGMGDIMEIAQHIKEIFAQLQAEIASGAVSAKGSVVDFLNKLNAIVEAKIASTTPVVKAALEKVKAAVDEMIAKVKAQIEAGIAETGKGILAQLMEKIMAKLAELKDQIASYNIFDDLLNDVLKPAIKQAISNLIPNIAKHLGDLADKLKPAEYLGMSLSHATIMELYYYHIKEIFAQLQAEIASGAVSAKGSVVDFLNKLIDIVEAKITATTPVVKVALEKVKAAVDEMIAKAQAQIEAGIAETGKGILAQLMENIMVKLAELKDQLTGYNIIEELLALAPLDLLDVFNEIKRGIKSGEIKDNLVDFLIHIKAIVDERQCFWLQNCR
jgi:G:T/U-mismatch repair DNA glycosylase